MFGLDNEIVDTKFISTYTSSNQECIDPVYALFHNYDLGTQKTKTINYEIVTDDDNIVWQGTVTIDGTKKCNSFQLTY